MTSARELQFKSINYTGLGKGPRLIITGAVHGNETCGTKAILRVMAEIDSGKLLVANGSVTFVPVTNPLAFARGTRFRISIVASSPPSPGIAMSMRIRSGCSDADRSMASCPPDASRQGHRLEDLGPGDRPAQLPDHAEIDVLDEPSFGVPAPPDR